MKAFLLAAGLGTRLRPLTDNVPKCLIPIVGRPLLDYWIDLFARYNVSEVLINTHYLREQVRQYIYDHNLSGRSPQITEYYEPELLGSAGTVAANRSFVANDKVFYICYADNLTNIDLMRMLEFHHCHSASFTMALFHSKRPSQCGIAVLDADDRIIQFEEKPLEPESDLANAGIYIADQRLFDLLPAGRFLDFGKDIIPALVGKMYGWKMQDYLLDIGSPENYRKAQEDAKWIIQKK